MVNEQGRCSPFDSTLVFLETTSCPGKIKCVIGVSFFILAIFVYNSSAVIVKQWKLCFILLIIWMDRWIFIFLFEFMIIIIIISLTSSLKLEKKFQCDITFIIHFIIHLRDV